MTWWGTPWGPLVPASSPGTPVEPTGPADRSLGDNMASAIAQAPSIPGTQAGKPGAEARSSSPGLEGANPGSRILVQDLSESSRGAAGCIPSFWKAQRWNSIPSPLAGWLSDKQALRCTPGPGDFRRVVFRDLIEPFSEEWQVLTHVDSHLSGKEAKTRHSLWSKR